MKYVDVDGFVYRLSDRHYWQLLRLIAQGQTWDIDQLGTQVCGIDTRVGNLSAEDAQQYLDWHKSERVED